MRIASAVALLALLPDAVTVAQLSSRLEVFNVGFGRPAGVREELREALAAGTPLAGSDFSNQPLAGTDFAGVDLSRTTWRQTDLRGARFTNCTLEGADFTGAYLGGAAFQGCRLANAGFEAASLRGAYFSTCDLSGVIFDRADIAGASLIDVTISPTGAPHLPALRAAIELRGGASYSPALLAAASGDAFAFTYNRSDRAGWPGAPVTFNPVSLTFETLGFDATYRINIKDMGRARKELTGILRRGLVAVLPMRLAGGGGLEGNSVEGPVWVAAYELATETRGDEQVSVRTPFGPMSFGLDDLLRRWRGPWPTLIPAGEAPGLARYPVCMVGAMKAELSDQAVILAALKNASAIMNESRVFGEAHGGFRAYEALVQDMNNAEVVVGDVVHWSGGPRQAMVASRQLAAEFLRQAAPKMPSSAQPPLSEAAVLYDEISALLRDEWPMPPPTAFEGDAKADAVGAASVRRPHAGAALEAALGRERRAIGLLEQVATELAGAPEAPASE